MNPMACFAAATLLLLVPNVAKTASSSTRLAISPRSTLILNGSSNVADWRCKGAAMEGRMDVAAPVEKVNDVIDRIEDGNIAAWMSKPLEGRFPQPSFAVSIPIAALRCSGGRPMESDMSRSLKADRFPLIGFRFSGLCSGITHDIDSRSFTATVAGQLSLAGVSREVAFEVVARRLTPSQFRLQARIPARMTDFAITPPTALFGMIKAADELSVTLDLTMEVVP